MGGDGLERLFLRVGTLVIAGVALGVVGSAMAAALLRSLLFGIDPRDPLTLGVSAALLMAAGGVAVLLPSYRAATADPSAILKDA